MKALADFMVRVAEFPPMENVFNPWRDVDPENDAGPEAPGIRRRQLQAYLGERLGKARLLLIGEALGYQGGHFSGIAMTSERILLGHKEKEGILPQGVLAGIVPRQTSRPEVKRRGFSEPTGTIVWGTLLGLGVGPLEFALWNTFAWHPYDPRRGLLSNRRPTKAELAAGMPVLRNFLGCFDEVLTIAVGRIAAERLAALGVACPGVRHPAQGGSREFRGQLRELIKLTR
jgi:uracil-DNA glycosylase